MRALVADPAAAGGVSIQQVAEPEPGPEEALVAVRAISLNRGELNRLAAAAPGWRPGWDIAGVVESAARTGSGPALGARVVGLLPGAAWAERVAVPATSLAELPDTVDDAQAAALPVAGLTALRMLRLGRGLVGRRVLITGAAGGVGRFAVQLARLGGAEVTAVVGSQARAVGLTELGAHQVLVGLEDLEGRFDLILESVGGESLGRLLTAVDPLGTLVMFGNSSGARTSFDVREVYLGAAVRLRGFTIFQTLAGEPPGRDLGYLTALVAGDRLNPQVESAQPWTDAAAALQRLRERSVSGKLVLSVQ
ncbi:MAG: zinc-binding dehydrogenase [Candidatus Dormibacteraeota bacterium]|uniref:Zinc-binding dehydrogenase n=1 Tax=Candidatus Dormiibacter inghamiae TaxID=3127013 RepID=A0A934NF42_9BACT|nr:zinc-binding dehydrogenase [Candidatus Dormibacteraeota bacterium]MBJ7606197.1 zinc-binding dehydrogenase [Candidatus Dormibacteraeota bacterium]